VTLLHRCTRSGHMLHRICMMFTLGIKLLTLNKLQYSTEIADILSGCSLLQPVEHRSNSVGSVCKVSSDLRVWIRAGCIFVLDKI